MSFVHVVEEVAEPRGTLLMLHGTGGDEHSLSQIGRHVAPGLNRIGVRGRVAEGPANRFFPA